MSEQDQGIVKRLRESAHAFRRYDLYDSEGDGFRLTVQADECDEAAEVIGALLGALEEVTDYASSLTGALWKAEDQPCIKRARAAIVKAKGGEQ